MNRETAEPNVRSMPGENARRWAEAHREHAATSTYVYDFVWDLAGEATGPFCTDVDGNVLMDFTSHVGAAPLGYNNPKILDPLSEFDLVDPLKIAGQDFYVSGEGVGDGIPGPSGLMERLVDITSHYDMDTVFLSNSGAEAVENGIKICYDASEGQYGVVFQGGFHGRTLGALSLNRSKSVHRKGYPEIAGVHDVPYCDDAGCDAASCGCGFFTDDGSQLRSMLDPATGYVDPDSVAYVVLEPVQGEGGYRIPSEAFMQEVAAVVEELDVYLVADEIQSGMGRTGELWGADHYPIEPDVITSAKGLRVGATISRSDVFPDEGARISSTWGAGDVIASAQGALTIDAIEEYDLLDNATERGRQMVERLEDAAPDGVVDVRGLGLMLAVEFDTRELRDDVIEAALSRGFLTLGCGYKTLRLLPPLDVSEREIDLGADLLLSSIADVN
ncbi:aspartate aminotransferase family protein [Halomarina salina]|uniref:Aspartate aminotransferase family protein n=1 Tax=Halomarina salina TaxID=1872699 RepID=A0ABD5RR43_9EURY|nr:aminotransferase class III-fold pyridoxal phosphate-dependent enzyme [Halomarina salina]